jgi:hypothetical protein
MVVQVFGILDVQITAKSNARRDILANKTALPISYRLILLWLKR